MLSEGFGDVRYVHMTMMRVCMFVIFAVLFVILCPVETKLSVTVQVLSLFYPPIYISEEFVVLKIGLVGD